MTLHVTCLRPGFFGRSTNLEANRICGSRKQSSKSGSFTPLAVAVNAVSFDYRAHGCVSEAQDTLRQPVCMLRRQANSGTVPPKVRSFLDGLGPQIFHGPRDLRAPAPTNY